MKLVRLAAPRHAANGACLRLYPELELVSQQRSQPSSCQPAGRQGVTADFPKRPDTTACS